MRVALGVGETLASQSSRPLLTSGTLHAGRQFLLRALVAPLFTSSSCDFPTFATCLTAADPEALSAAPSVNKLVTRGSSAFEVLRAVPALSQSLADPLFPQWCSHVGRFGFFDVLCSDNPLWVSCPPLYSAVPLEVSGLADSLGIGRAVLEEILTYLPPTLHTVPNVIFKLLLKVNKEMDRPPGQLGERIYELAAEKSRLLGLLQSCGKKAPDLALLGKDASLIIAILKSFKVKASINHVTEVLRAYEECGFPISWNSLLWELYVHYGNLGAGALLKTSKPATRFYAELPRHLHILGTICEGVFRRYDSLVAYLGRTGVLSGTATLRKCVGTEVGKLESFAQLIDILWESGERQELGLIAQSKAHLFCGRICSAPLSILMDNRPHEEDRESLDVDDQPSGVLSYREGDGDSGEVQQTSQFARTSFEC